MIEVVNLSKQFGPKWAVKEVSFTISPGEFFSFLGPNGAGKTTTIKLLTGLLRPTSGSAKICGYDIQQNPVEAKRHIGYIPDHPFLYERLTGREFLEFVEGIYQVNSTARSSRIAELLDFFELRDIADQLIQNYSHGMRQKLCFCAAFLHEPKVMIVDEPWVGLDPKNIRFIKNFLKEKTREGLTVFMSTHTLSIAEEVSDRVGIINEGSLIAIGTVEEIKSYQKERGLEEVFLEVTASTPKT